MPYVNPVAAAARVIPHNFFDANDAPAQWRAENASPYGRAYPLQAVTAALLAEAAFGDVPFFLHREDDDIGSWITCDGVDPRVDGTKVDIWTYEGRCIANRSPETEVFVRRDLLIAAGYEVPENNNPLYRAYEEMFQRESL